MPAVNDDIFDSHMVIQHKAFFNKYFFFNAFNLDTKDLISVVNYITDIKKWKEHTQEKLMGNKKRNHIYKDEDNECENDCEQK